MTVSGAQEMITNVVTGWEGVTVQPHRGIGYDADIATLRRLYPALQDLEQYLHRNGWENQQPIPIPETSAWG